MQDRVLANAATLFLKSFDNHCRVDAQHSKGIVEDVFDFAVLAWLVDDQTTNVALWVELVHVDCGVANAVVERAEVAGEFQCSGRSHRVADETLRIVDAGIFALAEDAANGFALLCVAAACPCRVRADNIDVARIQARSI